MGTTERPATAIEIRGKPIVQSIRTPQRIEAVRLFDVRPKLNIKEKQRTRKTIHNTVATIINEGGEITSATPDEDLKEKLLAIAAEMTRTQRTGDASIEDLQQKKESILKRALGQHCAENQTVLEPLIDEIILDIQAERKLQGKQPYTKDAIVMLTYEIIYGNYLWHGKGRKDGTQSYFRSHLKAAVAEHTRHGLTGLARIFSAMKHDDLEDLEVHKSECSKEENARREIKTDWLFCDELYAKKLSDEGRGHLQKVKSDTTATVKAVTKISEKKEEEESPAERRARDEENIIALYQAIINNGYAGTVKILEQIQNLLTLDGLPPERQKEKLHLMLRHYGILAKILELERAHDVFARIGLMHYAPEESAKFYQTQQRRIAERLGLNGRQKSILLERLLKSTIDKSPTEIVASSIHEEIGDQRERMHDAISAILKPKVKKIVSVEVRPTSIGSIVDIQKMLEEKENYKIEIPEQDPLFEVVIIVKNPKDIKETVGNVLATLGPENFSGSIGSSDETYLGSEKEEQYPDKGAILHLRDTNLGGTVKIRINSTAAEAKAKRGVNIDQKHPIPPLLRRQLQEAMREAEQSGLPILDIITETVKGRIIVHTDATRRQKVLLPKNGTALDLAVAIPGGKGHRALLGASKVVTTRQKMNGDYHEQEQDPLSPLEDGDLCLIDTETAELFDIGWLAFCGDPTKVREILKEARATERSIRTMIRAERQKIEREVREEMPWADEEKIIRVIEKKIEKRVIAERRTASLREGQKYVAKLQHILGFSEMERIPVTCMHRTHNEQLKNPFDENLETELRDLTELEQLETNPIIIQSLRTRRRTATEEIKTKLEGVKKRTKKRALYREKKERTLTEIGQGMLNPLRILAPYIDRSQPVELTIEVNDVVGVFSRITGEISKHKINIARNESIPIPESNPPRQIIKIRIDTFPPTISNYEILKLMLKLNYDRDVRDIQQCNPGLFAFPEYMEPMLETANQWEQRIAA